MDHGPLTILTGIGLLTLFCQVTAWWLRIPAILLLLLAGILVGPVLGWLHAEAVFGDLLFPIISLSVAVILFDGSLTLKREEIRGHGEVVSRLVTSGLVVSWLAITLITHLLIGLSWPLSFLFGAVSVVTGPTVIAPMLRTVRPTRAVANVLRWEGILIDPLGALLAVVVFEFVIAMHGGGALGHSLLAFLVIMGVGIGLGVAAGYALGLALRNYLIPEYLQSLVMLTSVFGVFTAADLIQAESGLLAVTVMGMVLANMRWVDLEAVLGFKENLSLVLISGLFIILASRVDLGQLVAIGIPGLLLLAALQFVVRPLKVALATRGSKLNWRERAMLAWIAPRGIVAAAVSALFALRLQDAGYAEANLLVPLTFLVIIGTVVFQSATAKPVAKLLKVAEPEPTGFLIVGANRVAREIGKALQEQGQRVVLVDSAWDQLQAARMEGLEVYYGNAASPSVHQAIDLSGLGRLLGLSPQAELNTLASSRYQGEFSRHKVYALLSGAERGAREKNRVTTEHHRGYTLFGSEVSYPKLASLLSQGARLRTTRLTDSFGFGEFKAHYGKKAIPLFAVDPRGHIQLFVADGKMRPESGWKLVSLIHPEAVAAAAEGNKKKAAEDPNAQHQPADPNAPVGEKIPGPPPAAEGA